MQKVSTTPIVASTSTSRHCALSIAQQAFLGKHLAVKHPYNKKIDNFLELEAIENLVITSIQDEEIIGQTKPVGCL